MKKVAVYTSPKGRPQRQIGEAIYWAKSQPFVRVRFGGDSKTYTFHRRQVRRLKRVKVAVSREDVAAAVEAATNELQHMPNPTSQNCINVFWKRFGL